MTITGTNLGSSLAAVTGTALGQTTGILNVPPGLDLIVDSATPPQVNGAQTQITFGVIINTVALIRVDAPFTFVVTLNP